jgi:hypothetical protein
MPPAISPSRPQRTVGTLWLLYGVARIAMASLLVVFSETPRLMAGALLTRVPNPFALMSIFELFYWIIIAWCIVCAILSFWAGANLPSASPSARRLAIIASFVSLPDLPFGLILGVYTLLVFYSHTTTGV